MNKESKSYTLLYTMALVMMEESAAAAAADVPTWRRPAAPTAAKSAKQLRQFAKRYNFRHKNPGCPGFFVYRFIGGTENH